MFHCSSCLVWIILTSLPWTAANSIWSCLLNLHIWSLTLSVFDEIGCGNKFLTWLLNSLIHRLSSACLVLSPCNCRVWMSPPSKLTGTPSAPTCAVFTYTCSQLRRGHTTYEQVVFQLAGFGLRRQRTPWTIQQFIAGLQTKSPTNLLITPWYLINSSALKSEQNGGSYECSRRFAGILLSLKIQT